MKWQPIDTCPKDADVILFNGRDVTIGAYREDQHGDFRFYDWCDHGIEIIPTNWMPLPPPPEKS